jgi:protein arginine kinase activator
MHKVDLCEACAQAKGVTDPGGFSLADLLLKASLNPEETTHGFECPTCGFKPNDFKKLGRFGCPQCYRTFEGMVTPMLDNMHKGTRHVGKVPHKAIERRTLLERIATLEADLASAIKAERYEDAARLRDELAQIRLAVAAPSPAVTDTRSPSARS